MKKLIFVTMLLLSTLTACGSKETSPTTNGDLGVAAKHETVCPEGFALEAVGEMRHELCTNNESVILPYVTENMAQKCKSYGGGSACNSNVWAVNFATAILNRTSLCGSDMYYDANVSSCQTI